VLETPEKQQLPALLEAEAETPQLRTAERRRLFDNIGSLYLLQGANYLIPMAVLPYLVRVLGMEIYGLVAFAQSFAQYFNIFTDYGFNFSATRSIAQNRNDVGKISEVFCCVFLIKLFLTAVGLIVLACVLLVVPRMRNDWTIYMFAFVAVIGNVLFPVWFFQGVERMRYISIISGTTKAFSAVLLFVFVHQPADGLLAVAIQSAGMVVAGVIGLVVCLRTMHLDLQWPSWVSLKTCSGEGWHLFVSTASVSLYTNSNVFLVGLLAGNVQAGYFSAAEKLIRAISGLVGPINQAVFPYVNSLARTSSQAALAFIAQCLKWMSGLTLVPVVILFLLARPIVVLCFGHAAIGAIPVMRWIAPLPFLIAVSNVLGIQTMIPFGLDRQLSRILLAAGALNVAAACFLIPRLAAQGAGISVLFTELFVTASFAAVLRHKNIRIPLWGTATL
jgi:PST family polysaccharide transporter